jgi:hypothetical protein
MYGLFAVGSTGNCHDIRLPHLKELPINISAKQGFLPGTIFDVRSKFTQNTPNTIYPGQPGQSSSFVIRRARLHSGCKLKAVPRNRVGQAPERQIRKAPAHQPIRISLWLVSHGHLSCPLTQHIRDVVLQAQLAEVPDRQ